MKKILVFLTALIVVSAFNPVSGQCQIFNKKKKAKTTDTTRTTIEVLDTAGNPVVIEVEDPQTPAKTPTTKGKSANMTLADVIARMESMEKSIKTMQKEQKAGKKSLLDSIQRLRIAAGGESAVRANRENILYQDLLRKISGNDTAIADLKIRAVNGDALAETMLIDISKLEKQTAWEKTKSVITTWVSASSLLLGIGLLVYLIKHIRKVGNIRSDMRESES